MKRILLLIVLLFSIFESNSQNWDINTLRKINLNRNESLDESFKVISNSVSPISLGIPIGLLTYGLIKKDSTSIHKAIYIGESLIIGAVFSTIIKKTVKRDRPAITYPDIQKLMPGGSYSFPSGHTSEAFSFATAISIAYPKWYVIAPSMLWASGVGYSRMHLGVHYPTDVIGGAILGGGSAYLTYVLNKWMNHHSKNHHK